MMARLKLSLTSVIALLFCLAAVTALALPVGVLFIHSVSAPDGSLTTAHYAAYVSTPGLQRALSNTALLGGGVVLVVLPLAFIFAFGLERTVLPGKGMLAAAASLPLLVPSLLPALVLIYLFGRQGLFAPLLGGKTIYGLPGVLLADAMAALPHAVIILRTALRAADARLYEQATVGGASSGR